MDNIKVEMVNKVIPEMEMRELCNKLNCRIISVDTSEPGMSVYIIGADNVICFYALGKSVGRRQQKVFNY